MSPRFAVGIDLGTTHSALSYIDLGRPPAPTQQPLLQVPQTVAAGEVDGRALLPSCLYLPLAGELPAGSLALPWDRTPTALVGTLARELGAATPLRLVASAKSWLGHSGVDRRAALLPTEAPDDVQKVSPVDASARYLAHLRAAWDHAHAGAPLAQQHVTLTVPASFDPAARELTLEAARAAGLPHVTLLEEPQAALYGWLERRPDWRDELALGEVILVVDVGGGTTDFSLIAVLERDGALALERVAVGDHILLGGDNMDLTLAYVVKAKLEATGAALDAWQLRALTHACRAAKELLLSDDAPAAVPVVVPSRGSKLVGASLRTELTREEALAALVEGFLPVSASHDAPATRPRSALTQLGLPYAQDAAITRHLGAFLTRQANAGAELPIYRHPGASFLHPTAVLLNGGVLKAGPVARRLMDTLNGWITAEGGEPARVLGGADLDHAVARGAAYHAHAKHADPSRVRIRGGLAQSLYVGVEVTAMAVPGMAPELHALCIAPHGLQEGEAPERPPQQLGLVVGEPVRFRCFASSTRHDDAVGSVITHVREPELVELGAIELTLPAAGHRPGDVVAVQLQAQLTELGALELWAHPVGKGEPFVVSWQVRDL
ncbi:MAG: Hsp70 family protein [Sandaracinaceae bacterium]|nr:Hsp70 family protein [Myxococcales bacterium]MCB9656553.1 Hsp70 family protein [Sandaracinaceae bacterium]